MQYSTTKKLRFYRHAAATLCGLALGCAALSADFGIHEPTDRSIAFSGNGRVDLRNERGGIFGILPATNQDRIGDCYAHAACSLIDFKRGSAPDGLSEIKAGLTCLPFEAGTLAAKKNERDTITGGEVCEAIEALQSRQSFCPANQISPAEINKLSGSDLIFRRAISVNILAPYSLAKRKIPFVTLAQFANPTHLSAAQMDFVKSFDLMYSSEIVTKLIEKGIPKARIPSRESAYAILKNTSESQTLGSAGPAFMEKILDGYCPARVRKKLPAMKCQSLKLTQKNTTAQMITRINSELLKPQSNPIAIDYCSNVLKDKDYIGVLNNEQAVLACEAHASLIIGIDKVGNEDYYLIRNSWGDGNPGYAWANWHGDIWVSKSALEWNVTGVHWLE